VFLLLPRKKKRKQRKMSYHKKLSVNDESILVAVDCGVEIVIGVDESQAETWDECLHDIEVRV
jgi:hypothetical protein